MKAHIERIHKEETSNTENDDDDDADGGPTDDTGTGDDGKKESDDEFKDCDPADADDERNYDVTLSMWVPKRHLLECTISLYEKEDGEGSAAELRKEFKSRYAVDPCLAKAIVNYERFNNVKKGDPQNAIS